MNGDLKPPGLGDFLRRAREARGLSLAQVEQATRISRRHLEALESDDLTSLPAPVFTRGLVRSYAQHVNASSAEAEELLGKEECRSELSGVRPSVLIRPDLGYQAGPWLRVGLLLLLLALVGAVAYVVVPAYRSLVSASPADLLAAPAKATIEPTRALPPPTAVPTLTPRPTEVPTASPAPTGTLAPEGRATATAAAGVRGVTIEARATGRVWAQAEADGEVVFSGILQTSEKKTWRAERRILLHVGNSSLLEVTYNGQVIGNLSPPGDVVKQEWTSTR